MIERDCTWLAPQDIALASDEVHFWRANLDRSRLQLWWLYGMLSPDEQERSRRFRFERDRSRFIACRGLLRVILGRYLPVKPDSLRFLYGPNGKPGLEKEYNPGDLSFSTSRSQGLAVYGVSRRRQIGVDIEYVRGIPESDQIAADLFSSQEYAVCSGLPSTEKHKAFIRCWTLKEAYVKATGEGLVRPLREVNVSLALRPGAGVLSIRSGTRMPVLWSFQTLSPASGYIAGLAGEGCGWRLVCWQQPEEMVDHH